MQRLPSNMNQPVDYLAMGRVTEDRTPEGTSMGGTVPFSGFPVHTFGKHTASVTTTAPKCDLLSLTQLQVLMQESSATSTYEKVYEPESRPQKIPSRAADFGEHSSRP